VIDKILSEVLTKDKLSTTMDNNIELLEDLCETMVHGSLCAMGGMTPFPVMSALKYFPEDFSHSNNSDANANLSTVNLTKQV
jgi:formate dehydrogenase iron-sulfur subunit